MGKPQKIEVNLNIYYALHPPHARVILEDKIAKLKGDICRKNGWKISDVKAVTNPEITIAFTHDPGSVETEQDTWI